MDEEKIEQKVIVSDQAQTGDITLIGKIVNNVIQQRPVWENAIWGFLSRHRAFFAASFALQLILTVVYYQFKDRYLIAWWQWALAAILLLAAVWGWHAWLGFGRTWGNNALTLVATFSLAGIIGWTAWQIALPPVFDAQVFGIALAELGQGPNFRRTPKAREISGLIREHLCEALEREFAEEDGQDPCGVRGGPSEAGHVQLRRVGVMPHSRAAQGYGARTAADLVIWGQVLTSEGGQVAIRFQMLETPDRAANPGFPLVLPVTTKSAELFTSELDLESDPEKLKASVARQATIMSSFTLGLVSYLNRDIHQAVNYFEATDRAMAQDPSSQVSPGGKSLLYFYLGRANQGLGRIEIGQEWLTRAQTANPDEPAVPLALALGYGSLGQTEDMEENLDLAFDQLTTWLETHPDSSEGWYDRGVVYQIRHQDEEAILDFEKAIEQDPDFYVARINLGFVAARAGRFEQAEAALADAIQLADRTGASSEWAHLNLAQVYEDVGESELARAEYQTATEIAPEEDWMYFYYAQFLEKQQEMDAALLAYQTMTEVTQKEGWAHATLADFCKRRDLLDCALDSYMQAARATPKDALVRTYLAETYFALGDVEEALQTYEEAVEIGEDLYYVYGSYGWTLLRLEDYERAAQMYERSLELHPIDDTALLNLGRAYENLGQVEEAKEHYFEILSLSDQFPEEAVRSAETRLKALGVQNP